MAERVAGLTAEQRALGAVLEQIAVWLKQSRSAGVSATSLSVLNRLSETGPLRVTELASREGVSQPAMTTLIDRLQERQWATRTPDPADGRATLIALTATGRDHIAAHRLARAEVVGDRMAELSDADQSALVAAVPALQRMMAASSPDGGVRTASQTPIPEKTDQAEQHESTEQKEVTRVSA